MFCQITIQLLPFLLLRNNNLLYSIILFINWLLQKSNHIILKEHNVKRNGISQVIQKYREIAESWSRYHRQCQPQVVRCAHCVLFGSEAAVQPSADMLAYSSGTGIRGGGENRPMGREAHPRRSQCSLLSSVCPPTSSTTSLPIVPAFSRPGRNPRDGPKSGRDQRILSPLCYAIA